MRRDRSRFLFCAGMMLTGAGTIGMWMVGKPGQLAKVTGATFMSGISAQAFGLTMTPSDPLVMLGMILVAGAIFGMWVYSNR